MDIISRDKLACSLGLRQIILVGPGTEVQEKNSPTTPLKSLEIVESTILLARMKLNEIWYADYRYADKPVLRMVFYYYTPPLPFKQLRSIAFAKKGLCGKGI